MRLARIPPSRRVWIFDLDNTLHDARVHIFPSMHEQINAYLRKYFQVDAAGADAMRQNFWRTYGTTLNGLMRHHGADPRHFLRETHVFPELADMVVRENALKHALRLLGGTKLIFSNAPRHYVTEVLRAMAIQPEVQWIIYGVLMVLVVYFLPEGIVPAIKRALAGWMRRPPADAAVQPGH